jgi:serine/threonine protein phosphatase PrpC
MVSGDLTFRYRMVAMGASSHSPDSWAPVSDHRWRADTDVGLFYVADASGPTYGGYHAPFGIDPGLETLAAAFERGRDHSDRDLGPAVQAAHQEMRRLSLEYDEAFQARLRMGELDRLKAALAAADEVRPRLWRQFAGRSLAHYGASLTACSVTNGDSIAIAQVGSCRAYRARRGNLDLLVPDHTLSTIMAAEGRQHELSSSHANVVSNLLGISEPLTVHAANFPLEPGDTFILCSHSVWQDAAELLADLAGPQPLPDRMEALAADCAARTKSDTTILAIHFLAK